MASTDLNSPADPASLTGYHERSHMNGDFRALSGQTPRELLDIMRRTPARHGGGHIQALNDFGLRDPAGRRPT
ncbi:hypothetical protein [Streptomyces sp. NPDC001100]